MVPDLQINDPKIINIQPEYTHIPSENVKVFSKKIL